MQALDEHFSWSHTIKVHFLPKSLDSDVIYSKNFHLFLLIQGLAL